jgi:2-polyprenyl-6-methoxyphenol hydroxylase-like FAD-dependent oxidoreductase
VLISGASVAGPTLAYWLRRHGFAPTVVERAPEPRPGGQAIDVRGAAVEVARRMGVLDEIRAARTGQRGMTFVDENGAELMSSTDVTLTGGPTDGPDIEILKDDLTAILLGATDGIEYVYGDSIASLTQLFDGVAVTFERGEPRTFDLVIGADGLHSAVRRLAFGPEADHLRHLNAYLAVFSAPNFLDLDHWQVFHQTPGKMAGLYSARQNTEARVNIGFESPPIDYDYRDVEQQKKLIADAFDGDGWEIPRLLEEMWRSSDFYFDAMAQVHMDDWSTGRVALVGDAGYCASPLSGQGTSLAMVGAYVLAGELKAAGDDHAAAFAAYRREMREFVEANQHLALVNAERTRELATGDGAEHIEEHWVATAANAITLKNY